MTGTVVTIHAKPYGRHIVRLGLPKDAEGLEKLNFTIDRRKINCRSDQTLGNTRSRSGSTAT
jgi:hypothetical protein